MAGTFEIATTKNGKYHFVLKAGNGEVVLQSQQYRTIAGARVGIASVKKNAAKKTSFQTLNTKNGKSYFTLKAGNGQVVGTSEVYETPRAMNNGIASVQKNAGRATTVRV